MTGLEQFSGVTMEHPGSVSIPFAEVSARFVSPVAELAF